MKRIFTIIIIVAGLLSCIRNANAQLPSVDLIYAGDSTGTAFNCSLPATIGFFFYGYAPGYLATDSIHMDINFGDGASVSYNVSLIQGPTFYGTLTHVYTLPGAYSVQFIATGPDGSADTLVDQSVLISSTCADISGRIYLDGNGDCIYNAGDTPVQTWVSVTYNSSQVSGVMSNALGEYFATVPTGFTYTVAPYNTQLSVACPVSGEYTISSLPSAGNDFALECDTAFDFTGSISGQGFRVNSTTWIWLSAWNKLLSCASPNATVTLTLDPMLSYVASSVTPVSVTTTQVVFNAGQLVNAMTNFTSGVQLLTNPAAAIGDTLCLTLTIDPQTGDAVPADNIITVCMPVRNSCDPNEKYEIHAGAATATVAPGTRLDYTIMFQNVGNDVAYNVIVIDELDPNLDLSTLSITGFSHEASVYLVNNTLKFEFNNINLAAASVNEPLSHGYITYSADHVGNITNGTAINNNAEIYFDFNAAIVTNTVTNIIDQTIGLNDEITFSSTGIFPNPANDYFIVSGLTTPGLLSINDITGRLLSKTMIQNNQVINTGELSSGVYFVTIEVADEKRISRLIIE